MISSTIHPSSARAQLIRDAAVIVWDEAPMSNKAVLACLEEVCRCCTGNNAPFGNKIIILVGDWRQTCPVIPRGTKTQIIDASIKSSPLWPSFMVLGLTQLIRNADDLEFANFVNAIGEGAGPEVDVNIMQQIATREELINFVFPEQVLHDPVQCLTRSILAPTNEQIDFYNGEILARLPGIGRLYLAADSIKECPEGDENSNIIAPASLLDYVTRHRPIGIPPGNLLVKVGGVYRIMRNFSVDRGLVKNARVVITDVGQRLISVRLLRPGMVPAGEEILLPRITFTSPLPSRHTLVRRQFPVAAAYACTFTGCQGLTCDRIGADLTRAVFSHGQLYTALSRIRRREDGAVLLLPGPTTVRNVTYLELLQ